ncbi:TonB-dependent receptor [Nitrospirillum viridazoti Y2]|nr:TonB-dependent receptor [Nitrospirillum amazonense]EGY00378.1 TonB-dependent receptor [Nitrospirillum amazonense Y2]
MRLGTMLCDKRRRRVLMGSALSWGLLHATTAWAQPAADAETAAPVDTADSPEEIIVTGVRRSNAKAIDTKLNTPGVTDVISADDAQALPDRTIVEALRRVPGLSVLPATDNEHPRDEAATPVIRGLGPAYNNVTIDGVPIASPGTPNGNLGSMGRGVRLDILPTSMISELQVTKTFTADLDPNAVGGAINLKTRSAFDNGGRPFFTAEGALGMANDHGQPRSQDPLGRRISGTGSMTFGPDHMFGVVVSANYQKLDSFTDTHMTTDTVHYDFYNSAGVLQKNNNLGNGIAVPQQDKYWYVEDSRQRVGATTKLEAQPTDTLYGFLTLGHYRFVDTMDRNEVILDPRNTGTVYNQTATSGSYPGGDVEVGYEHANIITTTNLAQAGLDWRPAANQVLSVRGDISRSTYREPLDMVKYMTGLSYPAPGSAGAITTNAAKPAYGFTYDTSQLNQQFAMAPSAYYNLSNYSGLYWRQGKRSADDDIKNTRADYRYNMGAKDQGLGFAVGASFTDDRPDYNVWRYDWEPNNTAGNLLLVNAAGPAGASMKYSNGLNLLTIDPAKAWAAFNANPSWFNLTDQSSFNNQDNFKHTEQTVGAYATVAYALDDFHAQVGLHNDSTDQDTISRAKISGAWTDLKTSSSYDYLLPSALASYDITHDVDVRVGASQTIGRPSYDAYAARTSISFTNASDLGNPNATGVSITIGNPNIKPRLSTNVDLAFDYKLPNEGGGLLSLALFNKDIKDEIFTASSIGYTYQGVTYSNAVVSTPQNASNASIRGVELNAIVNSLEWIHPWLRDFGVSGNWSFMQGELPVVQSSGATRTLSRLVGQPNQTRNVQVFYSDSDFEVRLAYNRQGKALRSIVPDIAWQDLYWAPREQLDLQASYKVRESVTLFGEASNLTHSRLTSLVGPNQNLLKDSYSVPTVFWVGVRFTPDL